MDYADLGSKWMVPIVVVAATGWLTWHNSALQVRDTRLGACIDKQFQLAEFACKNSSCEKLTDAQGDQLVHLTQAVSSVCEGTGFSITTGVKSQVRAAGASTNDVGLTARVNRALGTETAVFKVPPAGGGSNAFVAVSQPADSSLPAPLSIRPRVYIQISEEAQRGPSAALIERLNQVTFRGQTLQALGPDLMPINRTQLRCMTRVDCGAASELASFVSTVMGVPTRLFLRVMRA